MGIIDDIYQQFKDYFGEDKVDLQPFNRHELLIDNYIADSTNASDSAIIVYWPEVTVTNEYDNSVDIWGLYSLTIVHADGKLVNAPLFIRSTYDKLQWESDYLHSHVRTIGRRDPNHWHSSCLGSGPIGNTIYKLRNNDADLDVWNLYCWELDKYVHVESLTGVPYKRLQNIGNVGSSESSLYDWNLEVSFPNELDSIECKGLIKHLAKYLLENNILKYAFDGKRYIFAYSYVDFILTVSNAFIQFYNTNKAFRTLFPKNRLSFLNFLNKVHIIDNIIYNKGSENVPIESAVNTRLFKFKGKDITLQLRNFNQSYTSGEVLLVSPYAVNYLAYVLLKYVNLLYGNQERTNNIGKEFKIF